jgi:hypothetical protein
MPAPSTPAPPTAADPGAAARYLRAIDRRSRRRTGSGWWYEAIVLTAWLLPAPVVGIVQLFSGPPSARSALTPSAVAALLAGVCVLLGLGARRLGPVAATRAEAVWVLSSPLDRRPLLGPRVLRPLIVAVMTAAVIGLLAAGAAGVRGAAVVAVVVLGGLGAAAAVEAAAVHQSSGRSMPSGWWPGGIAVVTAASITALHSARASVPLTFWWAGVIAVGVLGGVLRFTSRRVVGATSVAALLAADTTVLALRIAVMEQSLDVLPRQPLRVAWAVPRPLRGTKMSAWLSALLRTAARDRSAQLRWIVLLAVPYLAVAMLRPTSWAAPGVAVLVLIGTVAAASGWGGPARAVIALPWRATGVGLPSGQAVRRALIVPSVAGAAWAALAAPAPLLVGSAPEVVVLAVAAGLAMTVVRLLQRPFRPSYEFGAQYSYDFTRRLARRPAPLLLAIALVVARSR